MKFAPWFIRVISHESTVGMVQVRLARYLVENSNESGLITSRNLRLPLADPGVIAPMIGSTKISVKAFLHNLDELGFIKWTPAQKGKVFLNDVKIQLILLDGDQLAIDPATPAASLPSVNGSEKQKAG